MPDPSPRLWLVSKEAVGRFRMGPVVRLLAQIRAGLEAGYAVTVVCPSWEGPSEGFDVATSPNELLSRWRPGDPVVVDAYVPGRWLFALLGSTIPFDADFYCVSIPETAEVFPSRPRSWQRRERVRRTLKYAWIARTARALYFSNRQQILSMMGMVASGPDAPGAEIVGRLPTRCIELPMGVRRLPSTDAPNPYPQPLRDRAVCLWGGGIWPWFDIETLLSAFARLPDRDRGPALFFLSGSNRRPDRRADEPVEFARRRATELGILDRNVFFNTVAVSPDELEPWLRHAAMGVMANPLSWESMVSWRTRYLDLVGAGIPLVFSGSDPLGERIAAAGGALSSPAHDPDALATNILAVAGAPEIRRKMSNSMSSLVVEMSEEAIGARWIESLRSHRWQPRGAAPVGIANLLRFRLAR